MTGMSGKAASSRGRLSVTASWKARLATLRWSFGPREGTYRPSTPMSWPPTVTRAAGARWGVTVTGLGTVRTALVRQAMTVR